MPKLLTFSRPSMPHDRFKDYTFAIGAGATKNKHSFHFRHTPVNKNTSKKLLTKLFAMFLSGKTSSRNILQRKT